MQLTAHFCHAKNDLFLSERLLVENLFKLKSKIYSMKSDFQTKKFFGDINFSQEFCVQANIMFSTRFTFDQNNFRVKKSVPKILAQIFCYFLLPIKYP